MSKLQKYSTPTICAATLLSASQVTPAIAAEPALKDAYTNQVVITVEENGEISSIKSPSPDVQLRSVGERAPDCINATPEKASSKSTIIATGTYELRSFLHFSKTQNANW